MNNYLQKKVDQSLRLLESAGKRGVVEVAYSGGKDSDVILELTKMAGIEYRAKQCEIIFPELKESEDEKIRKALIRFHKSMIDVDGIKGEDIIAWLEKQGKQEPIGI